VRECRPGHDKIGKVHVKHVYEIAKIKQRDAHMAHISLQAICRCVVGSAHSAGLEVVNN